MAKDNVDAYIKQDVLILDNGESADVWTGSADVTALTTSVNHREGASSLSFAKSGTTQTYGQISRTLPSNKPKNLSDYDEGTIKLWVYLSSLTNVVSINVLLGESASHHYVYEILVASLVVGWNEIEFSLKSPSSTVGNGATWNSINYIAVKVNFSTSAITLTGILVDSIVVMSAASSSVLGSVSDAAVTGDSTGTISAKIRGILKILSNVWDSVAGFIYTSHGANSHTTDGVYIGKNVASALTPSAPTAASVGTSSAQAVAANASRKSVTLINTSGNDISFGFGANAAVLNSGITLKANGGVFVMDENTFTVLAINAIAGGAASNLAIQEYT